MKGKALGLAFSLLMTSASNSKPGKKRNNVGMLCDCEMTHVRQGSFENSVLGLL